jgi:hypothetical protein
MDKQAVGKRRSVPISVRVGGVVFFMLQSQRRQASRIADFSLRQRRIEALGL